ncbi:MAG TPA: hypothetical protein VFZ68_18325 [Acidimicrobiales bacterium]
MAGPEVVARWTVRRRRARVQACGDCGTRFDGIACPACGVLSPAVPVAAMALTVELAGGARRLVVVELGENGRWFATRSLPATRQAIAALHRQHQPSAGGFGGWAG